MGGGMIGDPDRLIVIRPRVGVDARDLVRWLAANFQQPGTHDAGPDAKETLVVTGGNPLANAAIGVVTLP
jgi:hypothetical protein